MDEKKQGSGSAAGAGDSNVCNNPESIKLPEIDFSTFIFSLNSSALVHLGEIADPTLKTKSVQLPLAKQTIDILGMLEVKTKGNLTSDEAELLKNILHDLRLMYVRLAC